MKLYKLHEVKTINEMDIPLADTPADKQQATAQNSQYKELDDRVKRMEASQAKSQSAPQTSGQGAQQAKQMAQAAEVGAKHVNAAPQPPASRAALF